MESLVQAMKSEGKRRTAVRLTGVPYQPYRSERGAGEPTSTLYFERALRSAQSAESEHGATRELRLTEAKILLARADAVSLQQAIGILEGLVSSGQGSAGVFNELGFARYQDGSFEAAVEAFTQALALAPDMEEALFNRALSKRQLVYERRIEPATAEQLRREARADYDRFMTVTSKQVWKEEAARLMSDIASESPR
jgi:tetratricopeptide (TPR) repeat protein